MSFHLFPNLPPEIRHRIWHLSITPRTITIKRSTTMYSPTPPPPILHACHESRTLSSHPSHYTAISISDSSPQDRYIWVNISLDTIDVGATSLDHPQLRTLVQSITSIILHWGSSGTFMRGYDILPNSQEQLLQGLKNLNEVEIRVEDSDNIPDRIFNAARWKWPCDKTRLRFVLEDLGETYDFEELREGMQGANPIGLRSYLQRWHY